MVSDPDELRALAMGLVKRAAQGEGDLESMVCAAEILRRMAELREAGMPMDLVASLLDAAVTGSELLMRARPVIVLELSKG
jgi:hypothetical protein